MKNALLIIQIIVSIGLIVLVVLQASPENTSQQTVLIKPKYTRRGMEKITYLLSFFLLATFVILSVLQIIL